MKKKTNFMLMTLLLFFAGAFLGSVQKVQAANPTQVTLKSNRVYSTYDITGDGRADRICIKTSKDTSGNWINKTSVIINGKNFASYSGGAYEVTAKLYTLQNKKPFLYLYACADNYDGPVCGIFQYRSGRLKQIINCQTVFKGYGAHLYGDVVKIKNNTMSVKFFVMSWTVGPSYYTLNYVYKDGTLKRASSKVASIEMSGLKYRGYTYVTASYDMKVYTGTDTQKKAFTLKKGQKVKFTGAYIKSGKHLLQIQTQSGKKGWIKCSSSYLGGAPFVEVMYAG